MSVDNQVIGQIKELFADKLLVEVESLNTDLLDAGLLDSLALIQLLVQLEERFGVKIAVDELEIDDFRSIASIARLVASQTPTPIDRKPTRGKAMVAIDGEALVPRSIRVS
jgi:acyl carrier protein